MQFFAYDRGKVIFAEEAAKGRNYLCPECKAILRIKDGLHRRKHFFHLKFNRSCRQCLKTSCHLAVQHYIWSNLPNGEVILEKRFPSIQRIADVAWMARKLIFEIQCSPISLQEVQMRNADYKRLGFDVIWILHDHRFNRRYLSAAEAFLRKRTSYMTNIDRSDKGIIYDQFEVLNNHYRLYKGAPLMVQLQYPKLLPPSSPKLPHYLRKKCALSPYTFKGDLLDRALYQPGYLNYLSSFKKPHVTTFSPISTVRRLQKRTYLLYLYLLNKVCF